MGQFQIALGLRIPFLARNSMSENLIDEGKEIHISRPKPLEDIFV